MHEHRPLPQEQAEANAYWASRTYKKWAVRMVRGSGRYEQSITVFVGAETHELALRTGRSAAALLGHSWARSARAFARLATYRDLGAQRGNS